MSLLFHRVVFKETLCPPTNKDFMKNTISLLYYTYVCYCFRRPAKPLAAILLVRVVSAFADDFALVSNYNC